VGYLLIRRRHMRLRNSLHGCRPCLHLYMKIQHSIHSKLWHFDRYTHRSSDLLIRYKNYSSSQHIRRNYSSYRQTPRLVYMRQHRQLCEQLRYCMILMNLDFVVLL
jgi:hypothetical protein